MTESRIDLLFGKGHLPVRLPAKTRPTVIRKGAMPKLPDPHAAIAEALANPIGSAPLAALARAKKSACILICDITRPVPNRLFLRPMIETMAAEGIPLDRDHCPGRDRPAPSERGRGTRGTGRRPLGDGERARRKPSRARRRDHVDLGTTATRGTPIRIDRRFVEADLRIATGLVEPHFMAGWSGGRKVVAPGVAHHETIRTFHSARFMEDPLAVQCNLVGNPLHEEQLEIVRRIGELYALNTVIDEDRDLVHVTFRRDHRRATSPPSISSRRRPRSRSAAATRRRHFLGRLSARQDLLPDGQGHGDAARHPGAGRHAHHRFVMLGGIRFARVPRGAGAAGRPRARALPRHADREVARRDR